jgi:nucleoside-diphosphate-sugar epimerase
MTTAAFPEPIFRGSRLLVTGGAGFIGSHLVDALLERGARVRVLDNLTTGRIDNLERRLSQIEFIEGDIRDKETCSRGCRDVALVFHLAAVGSVPRSMEDPATTIEINVGGTANVLAAAREAGVRRIVFASSSSVYGDSDRLPKREGEEGRPLSPYALSKVMDEQLAAVFSRCFGLETIGLRYFNVHGPRQDPDGPYAAVIPRFFAACIAGQAPVIYGDGEQTRDFTFVSDAVAANLLAAGAPLNSSACALNVGGGEATTINQLAAMIRELVGGHLPPSHSAARPGDVTHSAADLTLSRTRIGYSPEVELSAGLARSHQYYLDRMKEQGWTRGTSRECNV